MKGKRFKLIGDNHQELLLQHQLLLPIYDFGNDKKRVSLEDALNLLNKFTEENESLKFEVTELRKEVKKLSEFASRISLRDVYDFNETE